MRAIFILWSCWAGFENKRTRIQTIQTVVKKTKKNPYNASSTWLFILTNIKKVNVEGLIAIMSSKCCLSSWFTYFDSQPTQDGS